MKQTKSTIDSCQECPHYKQVSNFEAYVTICLKAKKVVRGVNKKDVDANTFDLVHRKPCVPNWCPLKDYEEKT